MRDGRFAWRTSLQKSTCYETYYRLLETRNQRVVAPLEREKADEGAPQTRSIYLLT